MTLRIAMWSGPRNISTAMMRSFEARGDCFPIDEPFYAAFLAQTGHDHPMAAEVLASQPHDWRDVVARLQAAPPDAQPVVYEKHMTHHMLPGFGLAWMSARRNAFLIRDPARVLASYVRKRENATLADIGIVRQAEMFMREADRLGQAPPVVDGLDVLRAPGRILKTLCARLDLSWTEAMLSWPPGRRSTDGVWAAAWYEAVESSTGFSSPPEEAPAALPDPLRRIADEARPFYEDLMRWRIT